MRQLAKRDTYMAVGHTRKPALLQHSEVVVAKVHRAQVWDKPREERSDGQLRHVGVCELDVLERLHAPQRGQRRRRAQLHAHINQAARKIKEGIALRLEQMK